MEGPYEIQVLIHKSESGGYWATVAQLPGVFAAGDTREELMECLAEAIGLYIDETGVPKGMEPVEIERFSLQGKDLLPA